MFAIVLTTGGIDRKYYSNELQVIYWDKCNLCSYERGLNLDKKDRIILKREELIILNERT